MQNSFILRKAWILLQPSHLRFRITFDLAVKWRCTRFVYYHEETGGDTIEGEEIDSPGSPLGPWGPSLPLGPGSPWSPGRPLGPCGPWGPGGPYFPEGPLWPGLPLLPLTLFGQCTVQTWLLSARWTSFLMSFLVTNLLVLSNLYSFPKLRLWRNSVSAREIVL